MTTPETTAVAPYRLSPLGAHTDHQEGLTCGLALDKALRLRFRPRPDTRVCVTSEGFGEAAFDVLGPRGPGGGFGDHLRGVAAVARERVSLARGIEGTVEGELPPGGIASSAALQTAFLLALLAANEVALDPSECLDLLVTSERRATGVRIGRLDPAVILYGREGTLVFLDCREDIPRRVRIARKMPPFRFVLVDSGVRRDLRASPYNERVDECRRAAIQAGAVGEPPVLRDVDPERFRRKRREVDPTAARRAEHYFSEVKRVKLGVQAVQRGDLEQWGHLIQSSGESLVRFFDCGTPETVALLEIASSCSGVLGASFAGAGFGGLVQALVRLEDAERVAGEMLERYLRAFPAMEGKARSFIVGTGDGAHVR